MKLSDYMTVPKTNPTTTTDYEPVRYMDIPDYELRNMIARCHETVVGCAMHDGYFVIEIERHDSETYGYEPIYGIDHLEEYLGYL